MTTHKALRISETEWEDRYGWLPNDDGDCELLSEENSPGVKAMIAAHDPQYVWSHIDGGTRAGLIVPGFLPAAIGWYLSERPWDAEAPVFCEID